MQITGWMDEWTDGRMDQLSISTWLYVRICSVPPLASQQCWDAVAAAAAAAAAVADDDDD